MESFFPNKEPNLTTEKEVFAYIEAADSLTDLKARCTRILEANDHRLPSFWMDKIVLSGLLRKKELELMNK